MSIHTWTDTQSDGDINAAANWTNSGPPGAGDSFYGAATQPSPMTTNMAALTALLLVDVEFGAGYEGNIGASGSPLTLSAAKVTHRGAGILYFENGSTSDTDDVIIDTPSGGAVIGCATALISRIAALRGDVTLTATLTGLLDLFVGNSRVQIDGANTIVDAHVDAKGIVNCLAPITNLKISGEGAKWTQMTQAAAVANMEIGAGATVFYNTVNTVTGITVVRAGGTLDFSGDTRPKDGGTVYVFDGGRVIKGSTAVTLAGGKLNGVQDIM